jgi:uncharacterized LabA/DUF88 family protein
VAACDKFIYTEVLRATEDETEEAVKKTTNELKQDTKLVAALRKAVDASSDESGWAQLGPVGSHIANQSSNLDPRNYGYVKLGELIKAIKLFDLEERPIGNGRSKALYVRHKQVREKKVVERKLGR